jgi:CTP:molybdopterin cytidylyltransferase MocA
MPDGGFAALVLAGDRTPDDPLLVASGHGCKALLEIAGVPMVLRVLDALRGATRIGSIHLCGPGPDSVAGNARLGAYLAAHGVFWHPPLATPSTSAHTAMAAIGSASPVLLTTADHPLLQAEFIDYFCREAGASGADVAVGLAPYSRVREIFPAMKKTLLNFRDDQYCGCNMFAFMTPAGRVMADRWREVESERKSPLRVIRLLGWGAVLRYRLGWLSLDGAMELLSRRMGLRLVAVKLPFGDAAVDVDSLADHELVEQRLLEREAHV